MTRVPAVAVSLVLASTALPTSAGRETTVTTSVAVRTAGERHHYAIAARVRPLLLFWIGRSGVGDAIVTRRELPGEATYSLLIGSDPDRTPLHINRWGYIEEEIRGAEARLFGLMTESDEDSIEQAEANVRTQPSGRHPFKVIHATADGREARARVVSLNLPRDYTVRQLREVRDAVQGASGGTERVVPMRAGTRPGFLTALADSMANATNERIPYVYYGRVYELRRIRTREITNYESGGRSYGPAVAADFVITSTHDGEKTRFSMTYGRRGAFLDLPLAVVYQPRWWMQVELTLDDTAEGPALDSEALQ